MPIKTHFIYENQGHLSQVGLGFLPFVPRAGEEFIYVAQDRDSHLYGTVATFRVTRVTYELFGTTLPVSQTWGNDTHGGGCQVNLYVVPADPADTVTQSYLQRVIENELD
jgi:hypothetical protein